MDSIVNFTYIRIIDSIGDVNKRMKTISKWITIVLIFSAFLISSLKYVNVSAYAASNGSTIGSVSVEDLSEKDMKKQIDAAIAEWKNAEIYITVGD
ncbi:MAG TPA: hypothetical protein VNU45_04665, partial [Rummeliibacillus sp.]|nr:hypothetical protein [Rummeliibacillus sp.]